MFMEYIKNKFGMNNSKDDTTQNQNNEIIQRSAEKKLASRGGKKEAIIRGSKRGPKSGIKCTVNEGVKRETRGGSNVTKKKSTKLISKRSRSNTRILRSNNKCRKRLASQDSYDSYDTPPGYSSDTQGFKYQIQSHPMISPCPSNSNTSVSSVVSSCSSASFSSNNEIPLKSILSTKQLVGRRSGTSGRFFHSSHGRNVHWGEMPVYEESARRLYGIPFQKIKQRRQTPEKQYSRAIVRRRNRARSYDEWMKLYSENDETTQYNTAYNTCSMITPKKKSSIASPSININENLSESYNHSNPRGKSLNINFDHTQHLISKTNHFIQMENFTPSKAKRQRIDSNSKQIDIVPSNSKTDKRLKKEIR